MSQEIANPDVVGEELTIDSDVHLQICHEDLVPYLDEPWRSRMKDSHTGQQPNDGWDRTVNGKFLMDFDSVQTADDLNQSLCNELGVDYPIINTLGLMSRNPEKDWSVALMKSHNDFLIDKFLDTYDNFLGLATITTQQPDKAAEEIDRMGSEEDIVGVYIHNTGPNPPLGDSFYDTMWEAAEDNNLNIAFHGSADGFMFEFPRQNQSLNQFIEVHTLAHPWSQMLTMISLIVEGTVEKFPDLKWAFLEAGLSWVPYMLFRLNKEYSMRRSEAPLLEKMPEEYFREKMYVASQPLEEPMAETDLAKLIDVVGTDNILFTTDYPHWDFDNPETLNQHLQRMFDPEDLTKVMTQNAIEMFDLNL